jgi:rRNA maturation endonuclease Nob1
MKEYGWELFAEKCFCARDGWEEGINSIPGTWDEKNGCWYEFRSRCSFCKREHYSDYYTRYCPYCGKEMKFIEKVTRTAVKE